MAFKFYRGEYGQVPWLQSLMYRRSLYATRHHEYRRYAFPREQKRLKWLQTFRRGFYHNIPERRYLKGRR